MVTHSSILAWRISRIEEPGGLQSMGSQSQTWLKWLNTNTASPTLDLYWPQSSGLITSEREVLIAQPCLTLCDPMDCSLLSSSVRGILQVRNSSGLQFPSPGDLPNPGFETESPALKADSLLFQPPGKLLLVITAGQWWKASFSARLCLITPQ